MSDAPPEYPACSCCGEPESGTCPEQRCRDCDHNCPAGGPCTLTSPALPPRCHVSPRCYWCTIPLAPNPSIAWRWDPTEPTLAECLDYAPCRARGWPRTRCTRLHHTELPPRPAGAP